MHSVLAKSEKWVGDHFSQLLISALLLGLLVPAISDFFEPAIVPVLMAVIYLGFLKTEYGVFWTELRNLRRSLGIACFCLLVLPSALFWLAKGLLVLLQWDPEFALGVLLFFGCPVAAIAPTLSLLMKGHFERTLCALVLTAFLAPFTIPLLFYVWAGRGLPMDYQAMSLFLIRLIVIPFLLAQLTRRYLKPLRTRLLPHTAGLSVILLMAVVFGTVAGLGEQIGQDPWKIARGLLLGSLTMLLAYGLGWRLHRRTASLADRSTLAILATWTNVGLGIVFAKQFFPAGDVLLFLVLCEIPWNLSFAPAHAFIRRCAAAKG